MLSANSESSEVSRYVVVLWELWHKILQKMDAFGATAFSAGAPSFHFPTKDGLWSVWEMQLLKGVTFQ